MLSPTPRNSQSRASERCRSDRDGRHQRPAEISVDPEGPLPFFGGYVTDARSNCPGELIVQAWRNGSWKPGIYSIADFELAEDRRHKTHFLITAASRTDSAEHLAFRMEKPTIGSARYVSGQPVRVY